MRCVRTVLGTLILSSLLIAGLPALGSASVVCLPDPQLINLASPSSAEEVVVHYLGGVGAVYGYSIDVTWNASVATAGTDDFVLPDTGPFAGANLFQVLDMSGGLGGHMRVDAAIGGADPGTIGPDDLFKATFTGVPSVDYATTGLVLTVNHFRDNTNQELPAPATDDGLLVVDLVGPSLSGVAITNTTLAHTDAYIKDTDGAELTATVTDGDPAMSAANIFADLTGLGGGPADNPSNYGGGQATWTLPAVTCTPSDGIVSVTVSAQDPSGNPATPDSDTIIADNLAPAAVSGFSCDPAYNEIDCAWNDASGLDANPYRLAIMANGWGGVGYPTYPSGDEPDYPLVGDVLTAKWIGVAGALTATLNYNVDGSERDIKYLGIFLIDMVLHSGPADAGAQDRATNYWLGDIAAPPAHPEIYDGYVDEFDVFRLSGTYGFYTDEEADVGPTDDLSSTGIPLPDGNINFDDLMIFALNYGQVTPQPVQPGATEVAQLSWARLGEGLWSLSLLEPCADLKGINLRADLPAGAVRAVIPGELLAEQTAAYFLQNIAAQGLDLGLAILGQGAVIQGSGELVRVELATEYDLSDVVIELRDSANAPLEHEIELTATQAELPSAYRLAQNYPNPFNPKTAIRFELPHAEAVQLAVFGADGRRIVTLVEEMLPAGYHEVIWNGRDEAGNRLASGLYLYRIEAGPLQVTNKMLMLK